MTEISTKGYLDMELLRFTTAGSVDDGKSTLIGRLLYDSKSIFEDQLESVERASVQKGSDYTDLALLTDGLRSEREQGITIDVAYRYFATPRRKFIIADTPGHIQYTRNMVTGASTANAALILIDARNGVIEQTYRHTYIANLLQIPNLVVCVNKMDLVDYNQDDYDKILSEFKDFATKIGVKNIFTIPISALKGDNVVEPSKNMNWYTGPTLLKILEQIPVEQDFSNQHVRFPVQYVIRPQSDKYHDFRGYAGKVTGGIIRKDDKVKVYPTGLISTISAIHFHDEELEEAFAPMSVTLSLKDDIDISRGDMIVKVDNDHIKSSQDVEIMMCWMNERSMRNGGKYAIRHNARDARCMVKDVLYKVNVNNLEEIVDDKEVKLNDIARVKLKTTVPLHFDTYNDNRHTGSLILIDEVTNETVGVGMIL